MPDTRLSTANLFSLEVYKSCAYGQYKQSMAVMLVVEPGMENREHGLVVKTHYEQCRTGQQDNNAFAHH
ncbi:hypothetical protein M1N15_01050 [Dehalococcoidia bacterium]|nr:hypothetical protein [Dehalococcoidia bacterium]